MMITAQIETMREGLPELQTLLPGHYEELALNKESVPLDPQYDIYLAREDRGEVLYLTLRVDGRLAGYFIGFIAPGLHYRTCLTCTMDIFYIDPDHRGGVGALKLFRAVEKEAKRRGAQRWFCGTKLHKDAGRLFEALGFRPVETYYSKWIGG
jgi:GNAT superfamily N-acetyltransferase